MDTLRLIQEYYADQGWTDGLPVVPVTDSYLAEFLAQTDRAPEDVVFRMNHLDRSCTVRSAAINAAMAGCRPEYFPVVLAAWEALTDGGVRGEGHLAEHHRHRADARRQRPDPRAARDQQPRATSSARGSAPTRRSAGRCGSPRSTPSGCGRISSTRPPRGRRRSTPAASPRTRRTAPGRPSRSTRASPPREHGDRDARPVGHPRRGPAHRGPEQLGRDLAGTLARTGALVHETISGCLVLGPEHAHLFARAGWSKADVRQFVYEHAVNSRARLADGRQGRHLAETRWRLPAGHPAADTRRHRRGARSGRRPGAQLARGAAGDRRRRAERRGLRRGRDVRPPGRAPGHRPHPRRAVPGGAR